MKITIRRKIKSHDRKSPINGTVPSPETTFPQSERTCVARRGERLRRILEDKIKKNIKG